MNRHKETYNMRKIKTKLFIKLLIFGFFSLYADCRCFFFVFTGRQHSSASPVLATIGMSVRLSVCHTLALSENDAS